MVLLDTNIVSELMRAAPDAGVQGWVREQPRSDLFICAITEAELRLGVALLPDGRRRTALARDVEGMIAEDFAGRVLPFDSPAAAAYAAVVTERRSAGRPIASADAQISAIARSHGAAVATRNVRDFEGCGIEVIDPWR
jgi:predicted nucleic acid-binding protein